MCLSGHYRHASFRKIVVFTHDPIHILFFVNESDLEYSKEANPNIDYKKSEKLLNEFISEIDTELENTYNINIERKHVIDLDSSTDSKFSRHFIVHLPGEKLFENAVECGHFVKRFVGRLAEEVATGVLGERCPVLAECLFVNTKSTNTTIASNDTSTPMVDNEGQANIQKQISETSVSPLVIKAQVVENMTTIHDKTTCFVDTGVYTRNRLFRLMGSTKYGKPTSAALHISLANEFPFSEKIGNEYFYVPEMNNVAKLSFSKRRQDDDEDFDKQLNWESHASALADTFVVPINLQFVNAQQILPKILSPSNNSSHKANNDLKKTAADFGYATPISKHRNCITSKQPYSMESINASPFPAVDHFISSVLGIRNGIHGSIRAWSIEYNEFDENNSNLVSSIITYHMKDNRWCEYINRPHKSNNIMWVVSIKYMQYWQKCYDLKCCQLNPSPNQKDLPSNVKKSIHDVLLENALQVDAEFDNALLSIDFQNSNKTTPSANKEGCDVHDDNHADDTFDHALSEALLCSPHLFP